MNADFPRLLVATEFPPNASGGGPAVVRQMLKDWPAEQLGWWSCLPERDQRFGQKVSVHRTARIPGKMYPQRKLPGLKSWLLENLWAPWAARHFRRTVAEFAPQAIWVIPHLWASPPLAAAVPEGRTGYHVTVQDFPDLQRNLQQLGAGRGARFARGTERLYQKATTRDATSHPMIEELLRTTGAEAAQMLHAGVEPEDLQRLPQEFEARSGTRRIAYAGTVLVEKEFALFVAALEQVRRDLSTPVELHFFSSHGYADRPWFRAEWMRERGNFDEAALQVALRECDWGFAPMALVDDDPRYNRFSFPTKFITYLSAGLPVISLGHPASSVMKMAAAYDVGLCLHTGEVAEIAARLQAVFGDPRARSARLAEIARCAATEFDAARMRRILHECFAQCAKATAQARPRPA